ncbi:hypothetical protein PCK1_000601 [Pneumocystis canis]|nr:hypothetical protein PCK1_000601 [Pneumocystis canis]
MASPGHSSSSPVLIHADSSKLSVKNEASDTFMTNIETPSIPQHSFLSTQKRPHSALYSDDIHPLDHIQPVYSSRKKKLTGFVSSIVENIKHAWTKAKNDYHESLKQHHKRLHSKKHMYSLHRQKMPPKIRKRTPFPKTELHLSTEKMIQKTASNGSTQSTTFQSCTESLPSNLPKVRQCQIPLKDKENVENPLALPNSIDQKLETIKTESVEQEALLGIMKSLKEELEETKKRLEMFEKKYGLYDDIFTKMNPEDSTTHQSSINLNDHAVNNPSCSLLSSPQTTLQLINDSHLSDATKAREVFDQDSLLETLSPVILQNKNHSHHIDKL